jgi:beta-alanine degradation protein BauB
MSTTPPHGPDHIETATDPAAFAAWPAGLYEEMLQSGDNGCVGSVLVSETDRLRVWHLRIAPGKRCQFHRHVNPYFWSALTDGTARGYFSSGVIKDVTHYPGETRHFNYGEGDYMLHAVENIGDTELVFCTVEFIDGQNTPLAVPDSIRLSAQKG